MKKRCDVCHFCWIQEWSSASCWLYTTLWTIAMLIQVVVHMNHSQKYRAELTGISDLKPNLLAHILLWGRCELNLSSQIWDRLPPPSRIAVTVLQPCREWAHHNQEIRLYVFHKRKIFTCKDAPTRNIKFRGFYKCQCILAKLHSLAWSILFKWNVSRNQHHHISGRSFCSWTRFWACEHSSTRASCPCHLNIWQIDGRCCHHSSPVHQPG